MLAAAFFFPSLLNSSDFHEILLQKSKCKMVSQKKLKKANVTRHYPLHSFSLHVLFPCF
jgi:hypothetical protein